MRVFISLQLPDFVTDVITRVQKRIRHKQLLKARFTDYKHLHITIAFLGSINERQLQEITNLLRSLNVATIPLTLGSLSFIDKQNQSLLVLEVISKELEIVADSIKQKLHEYCETKKEFFGHITVARIAEFENSLAKKNIETIKIPKLSWRALNLYVMQSELHKKGSRYKIIHRIPLK